MESPHLVCLVCTSPIGETHLGVDACRACAAFFKRTQKSGRVYTCRQGNRACLFRKHEKFTCRSCRFDRCLELGMSRGNEESMLDRVMRQYKLSVNRRLKEEHRLARTMNLKKYDELEGLYLCNIEFFYRIYPMIFKELTHILRCVIPQFDALPKGLKESLCKNLIGKFNALEYYYRSPARFKQQDGVCTCSLISVFDIEDLQGWVEVEGLARKDDLRQTMRSFGDEYMEIFDRILKTEEIADREFHAMIAILVCQLETTIALPDALQHVFDETRAQVFDELQKYYREEMGLHDELHRNSEDQLRLYSTVFGIRTQDQLLSTAMQ